MASSLSASNPPRYWTAIYEYSKQSGYQEFGDSDRLPFTHCRSATTTVRREELSQEPPLRRGLKRAGERGEGSPRGKNAQHKKLHFISRNELFKQNTI